MRLPSCAADMVLALFVLVVKMEVDGGSPVSEAVGHDDGRGVPPQGGNDQCCFAGHDCVCSWCDGVVYQWEDSRVFVSEGNME
jgi:hypothetical protein